MSHNRGKKRRAQRLELIALIKGEQNKRRSDGRKRKPEMRPWEDRVYEDWSVTAEPRVVPLVLLNLQEVEAAGHKGGIESPPPSAKDRRSSQAHARPT